jgi:hypothetical protein
MPVRSWTDLLGDAGESTSYDPLPEGDYDLVIKEAKATQSANGKTMYVVTTEVMNGPHAKRRVWHNFVITPDNPNALTWFFRNMGVLGLTREYFASNPSDHQVAEALVGRQFRGQVVIRKWQNQDKNEIKAFYTAGGAPSGFTPSVSAAPAPAPAPATVAPAPVPVAAAAAPPAPAPVVQAAPAPAPATPAPAVAPAAPTAAPAAATPPPPPPPVAAPAAAPAPEAAAPVADPAPADAPPPPPF